MKRTIGIIAAAAFVAGGLSTAAISGENCGKCAPKAKAQIKCPVMGGVVKDTGKASKSTYKGKTYYFCCSGCKPKFDQNPAKYVKK